MHKGDSPNWYLERVEVTDTAAGRTYVFPCGAWLGKDKAADAVSGRLAAIKQLAVHACTAASPWLGDNGPSTSPSCMCIVRRDIPIDFQ